MALPEIINIGNTRLFDWPEGLRRGKEHTILPTIRLKLNYMSSVSMTTEILGTDLLSFGNNTFIKQETIEEFIGTRTFCFEWEVRLIDDSIFGSEAENREIKIPDIPFRYKYKKHNVNRYHLLPGIQPISIKISVSDESGQADWQVFYIDTKIEVHDEIRN